MAATATQRSEVLVLVTREQAEQMMPYQQLMIITGNWPTCSPDPVASIGDIPECLMPRNLALALQHSARFNSDIYAFCEAGQATIEGAVTLDYAQWRLSLDGQRYLLCGVVDDLPHAYRA